MNNFLYIPLKLILIQDKFFGVIAINENYEGFVSMYKKVRNNVRHSYDYTSLDVRGTRKKQLLKLMILIRRARYQENPKRRRTILKS